MSLPAETFTSFMKGLNFYEQHIKHRQDTEAFVLENAEPQYKHFLGRLYKTWNKYNHDFFEGKMIVPYIMFSTPTCSRALGDFSSISGFGGISQIRIRPSLLSGSHKCVLPGDEHLEGRLLFIEDVLLHETIHQYNHEIQKRPELSQRGHGPAFAKVCNSIARKLNLGPVRPAKFRGKNKDLPSCSYFPHCVRPKGYYFGDSEPEMAELLKVSGNFERITTKNQIYSANSFLKTALGYAQELEDVSETEIADYLGLTGKAKQLFCELGEKAKQFSAEFGE